jgi:mono/diheme cytochrome c family protein
MILAATLLAVAAAAPEKVAVAEVYKAHCQVCHMVDGNSPLPQMNFADGEWKHSPTPAKLAEVITNGVPGTAMLSFKAKLSPAEIRALAAYVRTFDPKLGPRPKKK